jgi:hypothetical protein
MSAPAPPRNDFTELDRKIVRALAALRAARLASARGRTTRTEEIEIRAEANLNALLDYRHTAGLR